MEKEILVLTCKECGKEFLYEYNRGRKPDYCPDCRKAVYMRQHYEYVAKQRDSENPTSTIENDKYNEFIERISALLTELDTIRVEMCELCTEMNSYQSSFDKNDQSYLHKLENLNIEDEREALNMIKEWKNSRSGRRGVKDLQKLLGEVINVIPYKNYANALPVLKGSAYYKG